MNVRGFEISEREAVEALEREGYGVVHPTQWRIDIEPSFLSLWNRVRDFTLTSIERGYALYKGIEYLCRAGLPGEFVECGVYRGGSCMLMALSLSAMAKERPAIRLYDTFTGMPDPGEEDIIAWNGKPVSRRIAEARKSGYHDFCRWAASEEEVLENLSSTGYPMDRLILVKGDVAETLEHDLPASIALLRLDTDWYASTRFELERLFPLLSRGGVIIIDDYGHFKGARKAVDEYFERAGTPIFLSRIDYTGRIGIKG